MSQERPFCPCSFDHEEVKEQKVVRIDSQMKLSLQHLILSEDVHVLFVSLVPTSRSLICKMQLDTLLTSASDDDDDDDDRQINQKKQQE